MKSKVTTGILAFFVGFLGIHRFYLGETGKGILYLVFFWFPLIWLIAFIDAIVFLTMDDRVFDTKYNQQQYSQGNYQQQRNTQHQNYQQRNQQQRNYPMASDRQQRRPQQQPTYQQSHRRSSQVRDNRFRVEGTRLYREYDFKGAIENYHKSLKIQPQDAQIHFNLACLYSLMEDAQHAFMHLSKAVEQGYSQFERVKTHDHLAFLRTQLQYDNFVRNGYRLAPQLEAAEKPVMELTTNVIEKLKQLAELRDNGILTEEEFQLQKERILRK